MFENLKQNKTSRQALTLFASQTFGLVVGFASNMLLAKQMGSPDFGVYSFAVALLSFLAVFYEFGYFASASRLLAQNHDQRKEREIIGASLIFAGVVFGLFCVSVWLASLVVDNVFDDKVGYMLRATAVCSWSFIVPFYMEFILKGSNHIQMLSFFNFLWKALFAIGLFALYGFDFLTPLLALFAFSISCVVAFLVLAIQLKPSLQNLMEHAQFLKEENKTFGMSLYGGRVIDSATYQTDRLLIGYFMGSGDVGLYSLATSVANPIASFSSALASSKYKAFSNGRPISVAVLRANLVWITLAVIGANSLGYLVVRYYLGGEYKGVLLPLLLMTVTIAFQASYQPHNAWLSSNGKGEYLRKKATYTAIANLALNFMLIPWRGAVGAALASLISMAFSYALHIHYYKLGLSKAK